MSSGFFIRKDLTSKFPKRKLAPGCSEGREEKKFVWSFKNSDDK